MVAIVTRAGKGSPLTNAEVDANFDNLNTGKVETTFAGVVAALGYTPYKANDNVTFGTLTATGQVSLGGAAGSESLRVVTTASAVNWVQAAGSAAGANVFLSAQGADSGITLELASKGNNGVSLRANGARQFMTGSTVNAVNYVQASGSAAGAGASSLANILFTGSDSSVNGAIVTKGSGYIAFAGNASTNNQSLRINTGAGSSSGNLIAIAGVGAGSSPTISAINGTSGTDANVDILLVPKGTGVVRSNGNEVLTTASTYAGTLTSGQVTTALGFTPYNSSNPAGYITSSALSSYLPLTGGTLTTTNSTATLNISDTGTSGANIRFSGNGATTPNKTVRAFNGNLEVVNSAYTVAILTLSDAGALNTAGAISQAGNQVLHAGNFTSYAPSLTGTGASGSWGISVTGSAGSVAWTNVTGRPTAVSSFTNDSGYITTDGTARTIVENNNTIVGTRRALNFIPGTGISLSISDNAGAEQVDITITSTVTGGVTSFNTRTGAVTLSSSDVTTALGATPVYTTTDQSIGGIKTFTADVRFGASGRYLNFDSGTSALRFTNAANSAYVFTFGNTGDFTAAGNITANSDERLKTDWSDLPSDFLDRLAAVKHGTYTRIDSGDRQIGVSAQSLQGVAPEGVLAGEYLSVAYGNVALVAAVELAKKVAQLEAKLAKIAGEG